MTDNKLYMNNLRMGLRRMENRGGILPPPVKYSFRISYIISAICGRIVGPAKHNFRCVGRALLYLFVGVAMAVGVSSCEREIETASGDSVQEGVAQYEETDWEW